jgi:hypothetical protein
MKTRPKDTEKTDLVKLARDIKRLARTLKKLDESELETLEILLDPKAMAAISEARKGKTISLKDSRAFRNLS